ncbi:hypothetical protein AAEU32_06560 [Pseudoalteromonas sp. SSDWG2]|uniref:hypothetical protein n=1 Tax=Pseudoalteromonas sp. SSDWG2 TaxID=3139391 RepID=UPI003BAAE949
MKAPSVFIKTTFSNTTGAAKQRFDGFWQSLNAVQRLYVIALLLAPISVWVTTVLTIVALTMEFWPRFLTLFHSLPGKALLLLFYGTITNFVLANAASTVNEVTSVAASHFNYTHNFAILLYLPSWMLALSIIALLLLQLVIPFYILTVLLIRPFQRFGFTLLDNTKRPILTAIARFTLCFIITVNMFVTSGDFDNASDAIDQVSANFEKGVQQGKTAKLGTPKEESKGMRFDSGIGEQSEGSKKLINTLVALFAYHLEADSYSRCAKSDESKVVELNDYEIVELFEDESAPYGIRFEVKKCISPAFPAATEAL